MKLISPMQRYITHAKLKNDAGVEVESTEEPDNVDSLNTHITPCGGFKPGKVHFDAEVNSKDFVAWKIVHPDIDGNCTIRIGNGVNQENFKTIKPLGESDKNGKFECGRE